MSGGNERTFLLPDLGEGLTEVEIVTWKVAEGDLVTIDQGVVEVETAKSLVEVPSPFSGRVLTLHAPAGSVLDVGKPLITITAATSADTSGTPHGGVASSPTTVDDDASSADAEAYRTQERAGSGNVLIGYGTSGGDSGGRRRRRKAVAAPSRQIDPVVIRVVSPLVRRLARDHGLDLRTVQATSSRGVLTRADVEQAVAIATAAVPLVPPPSAVSAAARGATAVVRRVPLNGFRRTVSAALSRSRSEIPEATVWVDVDATALWDLRESGRTPSDPGSGLLAYIARFVVAGLKQYPVLNSQLDTDRQEIVEFPHINLGLAVQSPRGLVVPAVGRADALTTTELDSAIRTLTAAARTGRCTTEELSTGTFTLNNYGAFRVDGSAAIINYPQVAMLGFGRILERPWVVNGQICVRRITQMSFVFDHRVCDGGTAAGFMRSVADAIEDPASAISRL